MDCSQPGASVHEIFFSGKNGGVGCHFLLQEIFPTQGLNLCLLHLMPWQAPSLLLSHQGSPYVVQCQVKWTVELPLHPHDAGRRGSYTVSVHLLVPPALGHTGSA